MKLSADRVLPPNRRGLLTRTGGMTLLEVVVILLVLGFLAIAATSRMTSGDTDLLVTAEGVASHLKLAQTIALNSSPGVRGIRFEPDDNTYYMFYCTDPESCDMDLADNIVALPGVTGANSRFTVSDGNVTLLTDGNVAYDEFGRPCTIVDNQAAIADEEIVVSLQDETGNTYDIQITPETGFIH